MLSFSMSYTFDSCYKLRFSVDDSAKLNESVVLVVPPPLSKHARREVHTHTRALKHMC